MKLKTAATRCGKKDRTDVCTKVGGYHECSLVTKHPNKCRCSCGRHFQEIK